MFSRADQLRIEQVEDSFRLHALEFSWEEFEPKLYIFDMDDGQISVLDLDELSISVSRKKTCTGSYVGDEYIPCPASRPVDKFTQCRECAESWIPNQECIFEPQCEGERCDSPICKKEHAVYVAFFGNRPKVGMTTKARVRGRLIEQGADAFFVAGTYPTRKSAREGERLLGETLKITERPSTRIVLESLRLPRKRELIEEGYRWLSSAVETKSSMRPTELQFLDSYPLEEPLGEVPKYVESHGVHVGEPVGIKGKYLIYQGDRLSALKLSDLPARFISLDKL